MQPLDEAVDQCARRSDRPEIVVYGDYQCPYSRVLEERATGASGLQNHGNRYCQFNWATPKSYANSCKTLRLGLGEGVAREARFKFTK